MNDTDVKTKASSETAAPETLTAKLSLLYQQLSGGDFLGIFGLEAKLIRKVDAAAQTYSKINGAPNELVDVAFTVANRNSDGLINPISDLPLVGLDGHDDLERFATIVTDKEIVRAISTSENPEEYAKFAFEILGNSLNKEFTLKAIEVKQFFDREIRSYDPSINELFETMTYKTGVDDILRSLSFESADNNGGRAERALSLLQGIENYTPRGAAIYLSFAYNATFSSGKEMGLNVSFDRPFEVNSAFVAFASSEEFAEFTNRFANPKESAAQEIKRVSDALKWVYNTTLELQRGKGNSEREISMLTDFVSNCKRRDLFDEVTRMEPENFARIIKTDGLDLGQIKNRNDLLRAATLANLIDWYKFHDYDVEERGTVKQNYLLAGDARGRVGYTSNALADGLAKTVENLPKGTSTAAYEKLARAYISKRYGVGDSVMVLDGLYAFSCMDDDYRLSIAKSFGK